jgi:hypothetical protein
MAYAQGLESGSRLAKGMIETYKDINQTAREREAARRIAAMDEELARAQQPQTPVSGLAAGQVAQPFAVAPVQRGITRAPMEGSPAPAAAARAGLTPTPTAPMPAPAAGVVPEAVAQPRGGQTYQQATQGLATPRPPQSELLRRQAEIYSQVGLGREAQQLGLQAMEAEREEARTATEQQRYDLGIKREDARYAESQRQWNVTNARAQSEQDRATKQFEDTTGAMQALAGGGNMAEVIAAHPNADLASVIRAYEASLPENDRATVNTAYEDFRRVREANPNGSVTNLAAAVEDKYGIPAAVTLARWAKENEIDVSVAAQKIATVKNQAQRAGTVEQFNKTIVDFYDPNPDDNIIPEWQKDPVSDMWMLRYGDTVLGDAGVFPDTGGTPGWMFARQNFIGAVSDSDPLQGTALMQDFRAAALEGGVTPELVIKIATEAREQSTDAIGKVDMDLYDANYRALYARATGQVAPTEDEAANPDEAVNPDEAEQVRLFFR